MNPQEILPCRYGLCTKGDKHWATGSEGTTPSLVLSNENGERMYCSIECAAYDGYLKVRTDDNN